MEIDRKISEHIIPAHLQIPPAGSNMDEDGPLLIMQRIVPAVCRDACEFLIILMMQSVLMLVQIGEIVLMYIHRGYFAKALLENPVDPLLGQYAHSYLSAYRAALSLLKVVREHYASFPNIVSRFWTFWSHAFSATV